MIKHLRFLTVTSIVSTVLISGISVYFASNVEAQADPTKTVIGYMEIKKGEWAGCAALGTNDNGQGIKFPIYKIYGVPQDANGTEMFGCMNSFTLTSTDTIKLTCNDGYSLFEGPTFTGPGTFTPNPTVVPRECVNLTTHSNAPYPLFLSSRVTVEGVGPKIDTASLTGSFGSGLFLHLKGSNFHPSMNLIKISSSTNPAVDFTIEYAPSRDGGTLITVELPSKIPVGNYEVKVREMSTDSKTPPFSNSVKLSVSSDSPADLNVVFSDKIVLNWMDVTKDEIGFQIVRISGDGKETHIATTSANTNSYIDNLVDANISGPSISYKIRAIFSGNKYSAYSNIAKLSTCQKISNSGPIEFVFLRGKSFYYTDKNYIDHVNSLINGGFKEIDPFKTYIDKFSFYVDLTTYDDQSFPVFQGPGLNGQKTNIFGVAENQGVALADSIKNSSSCANLVGTDAQYIFNFSLSSIYAAWANRSPGNFVYMNIGKIEEAFIGRVMIHEVAHSFAGLFDEYVYSDYSDSFWSVYSTNFRNCTANPFRDYRSYINNKIYGTVNTDGTIGSKGCSYLKASTLDTEYYRPSEESIMNSTFEYDKFNVISCGYIVAAINGVPKLHKYAQNYWPQCLGLDTYSSGIPDDVPEPTVTDIVPSTDKLNTNEYKVTGYGFTKTDNTVQLTSTKTGAWGPMQSIYALFGAEVTQAQTTTTTYEITRLASSDRRTLKFIVPKNIPDGTYTVSVGAFNSPWNKTAHKIVVKGNSTGSLPTPQNVIATPARGKIILTWTYDNAPRDAVVEIERSIGGGSVPTFAPFASVPATAASFRDTGLGPSQSYQYHLRMLLNDGTYGDYSPIVKATTKPAPAAPIFGVMNVSPNSIKLFWIDNDPDIIAFIVEKLMPSKKISIFKPNEKMFTFTGLLPNTRYCYVIFAIVNQKNISATSTIVCQKTLAPGEAAKNIIPQTEIDKLTPNLIPVSSGAPNLKPNPVVSPNASPSINPRFTMSPTVSVSPYYSTSPKPSVYYYTPSPTPTVYYSPTPTVYYYTPNPTPSYYVNPTPTVVASPSPTPAISVVTSPSPTPVVTMSASPSPVSSPVSQLGKSSMASIAVIEIIGKILNFLLGR